MSENKVIGVKATETEEKEGFFKRKTRERQEKKDTELEFLASMSRDERHEYLKKKRKRKAKKILGVGGAILTAVAGGYAIGKATNGERLTDSTDDFGYEGNDHDYGEDYSDVTYKTAYTTYEENPNQTETETENVEVTDF